MCRSPRDLRASSVFAALQCLPTCLTPRTALPSPLAKPIDCKIGQCSKPGVNDTTKDWPNQPDYIVDLDSAAVTEMGAWTSKQEGWQLCSVYVKLANGKKTSSNFNGDWWCAVGWDGAAATVSTGSLLPQML